VAPVANIEIRNASMNDEAQQAARSVHRPLYPQSYTEVVVLNRISAIGVAVGLPCGAMAELARRIDATGKEVDDLTIGELLDLIAEMPQVQC